MLLTRLSINKRNRRNRGRSSACEQLESRILLSVTPPTIEDVHIASSDWSSEFEQHLNAQQLGTDGYRVPTGNAQLSSLPWSNLDIISIRFSEPVDVDEAAFSMRNMETNEAITIKPGGFTYDPTSRVAAWRLEAPITISNVLANIEDNLVVDLDGHRLDGEWENGVSTGSSGDGISGGDFRFQMNVIPGDTNQSGAVAVNDLGTIRRGLGRAAGAAEYDVMSDINGSGSIAVDDVFPFRGNLGQSRELAAEPLNDDEPPLIQIDGGLSDRLTNGMISLSGQVTDLGTDVESLLVQVDLGNVFDVPFTETGHFEFATSLLEDLLLASQNLVDGQHKIRFRATDHVGNISSLTTVSWQVDTRQPEITTSFDSIERTAIESIELDFGEPINAAAFELSSYTLARLSATGAPIPVAISSVENVDAQRTILTLSESLENAPYVFSISTNVADLAGNPTTESEIAFVVEKPTLVKMYSPAHGDEMVSLSREAIARFDAAIDGSTLTEENFYAIVNGERLDASVFIAANEDYAKLTFESALPASTEVRVVLDGDSILGQDGLLLDANQDGVPGGMGVVDFSTIPNSRITGTIVEGRVLASEKDDLGNDVPLAGVTLRVDGLPEANVVTDSEGNFTLIDVPAPEFFVHIDGTTATMEGTEPVPADGHYPSVGKLFHSSAGETVEYDFDIHLPYVPDIAFHALTEGESMTVGLPQEQIDEDPMMADVQLTIPADSLKLPDGSMATEVGVFRVDSDRLPGPLPPALDHAFDITVQAEEGAFFDIPAPIAFPNVEGKAPGEKMLLMSFDHAIGEWLVVGNMTAVDEDGDGVAEKLVSDEGTGVQAPGWHGPQNGAGGDTGPPAPCPGILYVIAFFFGGCGMRWVANETAPAFKGALGAGAANAAAAFEPFGTPSSIISASEISTAVNQVANANEQDRSGAIHNLLQILGNSLPQQLAAIKESDVLDYLRKVNPQNPIQQFDDDLNALAQFALQQPENQRGSTQALIEAFEGIRPSLLVREALSAFLTQIIGDPVVVEKAASRPTEFLPFMDNLIAAADPASDGGNDITASETTNLLSTHNQAGLRAGQAAAIIERIQNSVDNLSDGSTLDDALDPSELSNAANSFEAQYNSEISAGFMSTFDRLTRAEPVFSQVASLWTSDFAEPQSGTYRVVIMTQDGTVIASKDTMADGTYWGFVLPPDAELTAWWVDLDSLQVARSDFVTGPSGINVDIPGGILRPSIGPDFDNDGLTDEIENILFTDPEAFDTDGDGVGDLAEIEQGLDPLGGRSFPTGVIASAELLGEVQDIIVANSNSGSQRLAYVATGSYGMAVVDVTQFDAPIIQGQITLAGESNDIAFDLDSEIAVVASGSGGVHFIDVSDPMTPNRIRTGNIDAAQVEIVDGVAFATTDARITAYEIVSGELFNSTIINQSGTFTGMSHEGSFLYTMDENRILRSFAVNGFQLVQRDALALPHGAGKLFVHNDVAYVAAGNTNPQGGFLTVDVSNPNNLTLISGPDVALTSVEAGVSITPNGSGLGLLGGANNFGPSIVLMNLADPEETNEFLTRFPLADTPSNIAIASGIAYVANGTGGLVVLNYLPFDNQGQSPTVLASGPGGTNVQEGSVVEISVTANDDVQVRDVELLMNGEVVDRDVSAPFDLRAVTPALASGVTDVSFQVRANDTGGNAGLSAALQYNLTPDSTPPSIINSSPANDGAGFQVKAITLRFDEPIDPDGLVIGGFSLTNLGGDFEPGGGDDVSFSLTRVEALSARRVVVYTDQQLPEGRYVLVAGASSVSDAAGNSLDEPIEVTFTSFDFDEQNAVAWIGSDGNWHDAGNWSSGIVPGPNDTVIIDRKTENIQVRIPDGNVVIRSLIARDDLIIDGGALTIVEPSEASGRFELSGAGSLTADGRDALFLASAETNLRGGDLTAIGGGQIILPRANTFVHDSGAIKDHSIFRAEGFNSLIDLGNLKTITGGTSINDQVVIQAVSGGKVDLRQVSDIVDPTDGDSRGRAISVWSEGTGSQVDLSELKNVLDRSAANWSFTGLSTFEASNGGEIKTPQLENLTAAALSLTSNRGINVESIKTFKNGSISVRGDDYAFPMLQDATGTTFDIESVGVDLSAATNLVDSQFRIENSSVQLANATNINGATFEISGNTTIDLPAVESMTHTGTNAFSVLRALGSQAAINLPNLKTIVGGSGINNQVVIEALGGGRIDLSEVTDFVDPEGGDTRGRALSVLSNGANSSIDLSSLTNVLDRSPTDWSFTGVSRFAPIDGGRIISPQLRFLQSASLELDGTGSMGLATIESFTNGRIAASGAFYGFPILTDASGNVITVSSANVDLSAVENLQNSQLAIQDGFIQLENVNNVNGSNFDVSGNTVIDLPMVESMTHSGQNDFSMFRATGAQAEINLPNLTTVIGGPGINDQVLFEAISGGQIDLSKVTDFIDPVGGDTRGRSISVTSRGTNSSVDLSALTTVSDTSPVAWSNAGVSTFTPKDGGTIVTPLLSFLTSGGLALDGTGTMDLGQIQSLTNGSLNLSGADYAFPMLQNASGNSMNIESIDVDFSEVTNLVNSQLTVHDGTLSLGKVNNIDGATIDVSGNAAINLPMVSTLLHTSIRDFMTLRATSPGASINLPALTTITGGTGINNQVAIEAISGAMINLSAVTDIVDPSNGDVRGRAISVTSDGTNSFVDLSSLQNFVDVSDANWTFPGRSSLNAKRGGVVRASSLTSFQNVDFVEETGGDIELPANVLVAAAIDRIFDEDDSPRFHQ